MKNPVIIIYYKYTALSRPRDIWIQQRAVCQELSLKGRILIAQEGINGTIEGDAPQIQKYIEYMNNHESFSGIRFKRSPGSGTAFPKLRVKVRKEIVTAELGEEDVDPNVTAGAYLTPEQLNDWFEQGQNFKIVDMRNDYEQVIGKFEDSIMSGMENFRDLKKTAEQLSHLKSETVVTVCTSGVRCEKASGYLKSKGFKNVYQLEDGIAGYIEKFPNKKFKGKLYVFDNRIKMGFKTDSVAHQVIGKCALCLIPSENYLNCANDECHKHFICCEKCLVNNRAFCKLECLNKTKNENDYELQKMAV